MSYDPQLYYNPEALPLPVVRDAESPLKPYEGTQTDDNGTVIWYPDYEQRERIEMAFQTCLSKEFSPQQGRVREGPRCGALKNTWQQKRFSTA